MDIKIAALRTQEQVKTADGANWPDHESLGKKHIIDMLQEVIFGNVSGEKAHRWLGWAQAATVAAGAGTLDDMKNINHKA